MAGNGWTWLEMFENGWNWLKRRGMAGIVGNGRKYLTMAENCRKSLKMAANGWKWL